MYGSAGAKFEFLGAYHRPSGSRGGTSSQPSEQFAAQEPWASPRVADLNGFGGQAGSHHGVPLADADPAEPRGLFWGQGLGGHVAIAEAGGDLAQGADQEPHELGGDRSGDGGLLSHRRPLPP